MASRRRPLVAGNWKMNGLVAEGIALAAALSARVAAEGAPCEIAVCPPATLLTRVGEALRPAGDAIALGGQDCAAQAGGAHTGDISAAMLADAGCRFVIVGHSERRAGHRETNETVRAKAEAARAAGLVPIVCIGESEAERDAGGTLAVVGAQLEASLPRAGGAELVVAYEPVWAIGSGRTPSAGEVAEVHAFLRRRLDAISGIDADAVRLLYGGSVKPANAKALFAVAEVDGGLIGGASLNADEFWAICQSGGDAV
jgi:triosephosphate isomerase